MKQSSQAATSTDKLFYIVGPVQSRNSLIASFLEQQTGARCLIAKSLSDLPQRDDENSGQVKLVLWDCWGKDVETWLLEIEKNADKISSQDYVALYNVPHVPGIEEEIIARGAQGLFYKTDPPERLERGVRAILGRKLWVSGKVLAEYMGGKKNQNPNPKRHEKDLARRETEILMHVASGASNKQIANKLNISANTVRTHVFNIYEKINARNRVQAALWVAQNMPDRR